MSGLFQPAIAEDEEAVQIVRGWIMDLRSGDYEQGHGRLRRTAADGSQRFCCLGVLCNRVDSGAWDLDDGWHDGLVGGFSTGTLPESVYVRLHIAGAEGGFVRDEFDADELTSLNDSGTSFESIADVIESELEEALTC